MIRIEETGPSLVLEYEVDFGPADWISERLLSNGHVTLAKTFHFEEKHIFTEGTEADEEKFRFRLRAARILAQDWYARRVTQKLRERNLRDEQLKAVSPNIAIPLLEAAQDETGDELREVWARLLANAMDPNRSSRVRLEFIETLKQFNPPDALLLNELVTTPNMSPNSRDFLVNRLHLSRDEVVVSSQHLTKLGCIEVSTTDRGNYGVLPYGKLLLSACEGP
jgi:abortive infection alpha-like protein